MFSAIKTKSTALLSSRAEMDKYSKLLILFSLICLGNCASENELLNNSDKGKAAVNTTAHNEPTILNKHLIDNKNSSEHSKKYSSDMEEFKDIMFEYAEDVLNRNKINIMPGVYIEKKALNDSSIDKIEKKSFDASLISTIEDFTDTHVLKIELSRAMTGTGRLFFFKGN